MYLVREAHYKKELNCSVKRDLIELGQVVFWEIY